MSLRKQERLEEILARMSRVWVGYSGGVDSTYLLHEAHRICGEACTAVMAISPSVPSWDQEHAEQVATRLGVELHLVESRELDHAEYRRNEPDRCYHCKAELGRILVALSSEAGEGTLVYGAVTDDLGDTRPGMEAARKAGIRAPLIEADLSKAEVRELSRRAGLPGWDRPASPCLASRLPYGTPVTRERLAQVEKAESALRKLGWKILRVRHYGETARLELGAEELRSMRDPSMSRRVHAAVRAAGFFAVEVDPRGYRSGSLNEALPVLS